MGRRRIGIIGGGASGMMAAITAVREGADVTLFEKNARVGQKLLVTGNGRCNLSNLCQEPEYYYSGDMAKAAAVLNAFTVDDTIHFFQSVGLFLQEKNGALYPACGQASAVLDVLRYELKHAGVHVVAGALAKDVAPIHKKDGKNAGFLVKTPDGQHAFDAVILACGGQAGLAKGDFFGGYELAARLGHTVITPMPALAALKCGEDFFKAIAGVRCNAFVRLLANGTEIAAEYGQIQLTAHGISGIPAFQLCRHAAYALAAGKKVLAEMDFWPDIPEDVLRQIIQTRYILQNDRTMEEFTGGTLHKKLCLLFMKLAKIRGDALAGEIGEEQITAMFLRMKHFFATIKATHPFSDAQVCAGGVSMDEVSMHMESLKMPGLYFAGELLDVDGKCGGYNLQWAWSSGYAAGKHSAEAAAL